MCPISSVGLSFFLCMYVRMYAWIFACFISSSSETLFCLIKSIAEALDCIFYFIPWILLLWDFYFFNIYLCWISHLDYTLFSWFLKLSICISCVLLNFLKIIILNYFLVVSEFPFFLWSFTGKWLCSFGGVMFPCFLLFLVSFCWYLHICGNTCLFQFYGLAFLGKDFSL